MLSKWLTEILVLLAVGLGFACVCLWFHEHDIRPFGALLKRMRKISIIGICAAALWTSPFVHIRGEYSIGKWQHWYWQHFHIGTT